MKFDIDLLEREYGKKIPKRIADLEQAANLFKQEFRKKHSERTLHISVDVLRQCAYLYFHWAFNIVKPFVRNLSDRYKIASNTEFTIILLQPLTIDKAGPGENLELNSSFAFYVALNIIQNFDEAADSAHTFSNNILTFKGGIAVLEDRMDKIIENHRRYMRMFNYNGETPPIILNAFVWEMIDLFYQFQWQTMLI